MKSIPETSEREERRTVLRPVTELEYQDQQYTQLRPVTTTETQWQNRSALVDVPAYVPGPTRNRLRWLPRTSYQNPETGLATSQRAGFYWVPQQRPGTWQSRKYVVPNYVPQQVQRTSYVPETITQKVPVQRTRYEQHEEVRKVPVQTYKTVSEEQVRYVPETVRKPVIQRQTRKVPVTTTRWEEQEVVRRIPVRTYKMEYEDRVEQVPIRVNRVVPEQRMVEYQQKVRRYVPHVSERIVAKRVMMKEPIPDDCALVSPSVSPTPWTVSTPAYDYADSPPTLVEKQVLPDKLELNSSDGKKEAAAEADPEKADGSRPTRGEKPVVQK